MSNLIGQSLGRYHILEQLGEGGMATVYKAYDTRLETDVAVKVIRTENILPSTLERTLKRFEREAKALARLTHPNIVSVKDYGEHDGKPYLVMEYLPGGTLKTRLGKPIPWQETVKLILPIAEALDFAHSQNMIHRDVKPANILLTLRGQPMLTDFGIAKILDLEETADLTGTGMGIGTPEYMAPEQWTGKTSAQSDQYALGVVLYEMLTGRKPYTADTPAAILLKQATEPLPRPTQYVPDLPEGVERILIKALARDPKDRFQGMAELAAAMEKMFSGHQAGTQSVKAAAAFPTRGDTSSTIQQDDSRVTRIQEGTRAALSMSRVEAGNRGTTELIPHTAAKKGFPGWAIAGIGGLVILMICIGLAFAIGILGRDNHPAQPEPLPSVLPDNPVVPTEFEPQPVPTKPPVFPTNPPPTYAPLPTLVPLPSYTPYPTQTPAPAKSPPVVDSIGIPATIVCDGRRYDVPIYFHDPDGDAYQIYWELVNSRLNSPLYSTLREFSMDAQTQMTGAVFMDWIEWNTAGDDVRIRVYLYDRTGLKGWMDFSFRCSN
jgi:serine/threonine protein kinase